MAKGLTRQVVVDAALAVLDERGLDGLTVRAVAERLDVKAPALYWHVRDKQELLDEMGTRVWTDIARAAARRPGDDWRAVMLRYARAARAGLLAHRDGARAFSGTYLVDPEVLRASEPGLAWLEGEGFPPAAAARSFSILTSFVVGHCIEEQARAQAPDDRYSVEKRDARLGAEANARVALTGRVLAGDAGELFEGLLDIVLAGIAGLRTGSDDRAARASEEVGGSP